MLENTMFRLNMLSIFTKCMSYLYVVVFKNVLVGYEIIQSLHSR